MALTDGARLGPYAVAGAIGAGGMGEVYRARDTRLDRDVALKTLPPAVAHDADRLRRFEREARLLAALRHPNIATLYALEHLDDQHVLVMEFVPGEDLSTRLRRGAIPLDEALPIAIQVAAALEAAHERNIIHRDLKPANIKVADDGTVRVLDFGLAKALFVATDATSEDPTVSPTVTTPETERGVILGTAAYMSPEQARGRMVDKRADIWAFGVVLLEMLTGRRAFKGEDVPDTLAAVLRGTPGFERLPAGTPAALRALLRHCLERDPRNRLHDIADARIVLEDLVRGDGREPDAASEPGAMPRRASPGWIALVATVSAIAGGAATYWLWPRRPQPASAHAVRFTIAPPAGVQLIQQPAMASDGTFVVFVGYATSGSQLYLQRFDRAEPVALAHTDGATQPVVSPDGQWIGFLQSGHLARIRSGGSDPLVVADVAAPAPGSTWGRDGRLVVSRSWLGGLSTVPASGGPLQSLRDLDASKGEKGLWYPFMLPDDRRVLYTVWHAGGGLNDAEIGVLDVATGVSHIVGPGAHASFIAPDILVFFQAGGYYAVRVDPQTLAPKGDPVRVLENAWDIPPEGYVPEVSVTSNGEAAYVTGRSVADLVLAWVSPGGRREPLPFPPHAYTSLSLAPDGRRAVAGVLEAGRYVVRLLDFDRKTEERVDLPDGTWSPLWHPDGRRIAVRTMRKGDFDIYLKDLTRDDPMQPLLVTNADETPEAWAPDGQHLIVEQSNPDGHYDLKMLDLAHPADTRPVAEYSGNEMDAVSPDGRWLASCDRHTGRLEVYVRPLGGQGAPVRVSSDGGEAVAWVPNSHDLLYAHVPDILDVTYRDEGGTFRVVSERVWARVPDASYDRIFEIGRDGRVLTALPKDGPLRPQLRIILNWAAELRDELR